MTQSSNAQPISSDLAWRTARKGRTLAQRKADFEKQVRSTLAANSQMAVTDPDQVKARMKRLRARYADEVGRKVTQYEIAGDLGVPHRTFQSWENAEVETDKANYEMVAKFYSRKLKEKITANWILFECDAPPPLRIAPPPPPEAAPETDAILDRLDAMATKLDAAVAERADLRRQLTEIQERLGPPPSEGTG